LNVSRKRERYYEKRRNLTYREGEQNIKEGATGEIQRVRGNQANTLKNIVQITGSDWSKVED